VRKVGEQLLRGGQGVNQPVGGVGVLVAEFDCGVRAASEFLILALQPSLLIG
jgi:hypothetical protein